MDRKKLIEMLNSLCWDARRYGHDDYGLDGFGVDIDGKDVDEDDDTDEEVDVYHREAVRMADRLLAEWGKS